MKTILITNDDGIEAGGIVRLAEAAAEFGEVWVVAPARQMSAASHSITLHSPVDIYPHSFPVPGVRAFSCSGTPGDCVRVGSLSILPRRPDMVLSGTTWLQISSTPRRQGPLLRRRSRDFLPSLSRRKRFPATKLRTGILRNCWRSFLRCGPVRAAS